MKPIRVLVPAVWLHAVFGARVEISELLLADSEQEQKSNINICAAVSQETLETHRRCSASLQTPSVLQRFPNLEEEWCDLRLMDLTGHHCESEEEDRLQQAALLETSFQRITALIGSSEETLAAEGAWESCSSRHDSCVECESRYAGAREHIATAHACEWRAGACAKSSRQRPRPWGEAASVCGQDPAAGSFLETSGWARSHGTSARTDGNHTGDDGRRLALLVGFSYSGKNALKGTYIDIQNAFKLLTAEKGFDAREIFVIYDKGDPSDFVHNGHQATISKKFDGTPTSFWERVHQVPISRLGPGDFFFFYFAGHGSRMATKTRDSKELDGQDEWLATPNAGQIMDNDFYNFLLGFPTGASVTAVADACHSEGFSDLPFNYNVGRAGDEHFESEREWCTDWAHAMDELPRARITYISGSQNEQTSGDLGSIGLGGVFSNYALRRWNQRTDSDRLKLGQIGALARTGAAWLAHPKDPWERGTRDSLFYRFKDMLKQFKRQRRSQEPNVCMWPTMTDSLIFDPFSPPPFAYGTPEYLIDYRPFVGGRRDGHYAMAVPPICQHEGRSRAAAVTPAARSSHSLSIVPALKYAGLHYGPGDQWEGWVGKEYLLRLSPSDSRSRIGHGILLSADSPDVVKYVHPRSMGERAGVRIGDIIRSVDGVPFKETSAGALDAGGTVKVVGTRS